MNIPTLEMMPRVALESMNHTHEEELALVEQLLNLLTQQPQNIFDIQLAEQWYAHTKAHFASEESIMQEIGFPAHHVHKGEHEKVLTKITHCMLELRNDRISPLTLFLTQHWAQWFMLHVQTMDAATAMFASRSGL